jgi:hypothetical protein
VMRSDRAGDFEQQVCLTRTTGNTEGGAFAPRTRRIGVRGASRKVRLTTTGQPHFRRLQLALSLMFSRCGMRLGDGGMARKRVYGWRSGDWG